MNKSFIENTHFNHSMRVFDSIEDRRMWGGEPSPPSSFNKSNHLDVYLVCMLACVVYRRYIDSSIAVQRTNAAYSDFGV